MTFWSSTEGRTGFMTGINLRQFSYRWLKEKKSLFVEAPLSFCQAFSFFLLYLFNSSNVNWHEFQYL